MKYFLLAAMILIGSVGQFLIKHGVNSVAKRISFGAANEIARSVFIFLTNKWITGAIFLYGFGVLIWFFLLTKYDLSFLLPFVTAAVFIAVLLISALFLDEPLTSHKIVGCILISLGIIVASMK